MWMGHRFPEVYWTLSLIAEVRRMVQSVAEGGWMV
jgi:hypothetical protein